MQKSNHFFFIYIKPSFNLQIQIRKEVIENKQREDFIH